MQSVAVGWEIYDRTGSQRALAMVGLVQVIPVVVLGDRRRPRGRPLSAEMDRGRVDGAGRAWARWRCWRVSVLELPIEMMYGCLLLIAIGRAFHQPAKSALLPQLVPRELFSSAVSWSMTGFQLSSVLGPALGGFLIAATQRHGRSVYVC